MKLQEMYPHKYERQKDFISRFMSDDEMEKEFPNTKQRYAVAMSYWERRLKHRRKNEAFLDDEEKFYDYHTGDVSENDIFDTSKTGMSFYDDYLRNLSYKQKEKNRTAKIVQMSPNEYFEWCAKIFKSTASKQKQQTAYDKNTLQHLTEVITKYHKKFPITFIDIADSGQEGRHRMYVAGTLFGFDTKFPVLFITIFDEKREKQIIQDKINSEIEWRLNSCLQKALTYTFSSIEEFIDEVQFQIDSKMPDYIEEQQIDKNLHTVINDNNIILQIENVEISVDISSIQIKEKEEGDEEIDDIDWEDIDLDDELQKLMK